MTCIRKPDQFPVLLGSPSSTVLNLSQDDYVVHFGDSSKVLEATTGNEWKLVSTLDSKDQDVCGEPITLEPQM